jgi:hypothetical protein
MRTNGTEVCRVHRLAKSTSRGMIDQRIRHMNDDDDEYQHPIMCLTKRYKIISFSYIK